MSERNSYQMQTSAETTKHLYDDFLNAIIKTTKFV